MNTQRTLLRALLVGVVLAPLPSFAQQQPSDTNEYPVTIEWARWDIQVNNDGTSTEIFDTGWKINAEAAVSQGFGQYSIPFKVGAKDVEIQEASTIKPDGRRIFVSPSQVFSRASPVSVAAPTFSDVKIKVVVFPDVAVGDYLLLKAKTVQKPSLGSHFSRLIYVPRNLRAKNIEVRVREPLNYPFFVQAVDMQGGRIEDLNGQAQWFWKAQVEDPVTAQPGTVAPLDYSPRVLISSMPDFTTIAAAYQNGTAEKLRLTPKIQALAGELTAGISDPREQAKVLYNWVSRQIRYVGVWLGDGGFVPHDASAVLENRYGDCKDHVVLLQSLLAAKGIESSPILINFGSSYWKPGVAVAEFFNHVITYVPSLDLYLDSTAQFAPFGVLPLDDQDKFVVQAVNGQTAKTPRHGPGDNTLHTTVTMRLLSDGSVDGRSAIAVRGPSEVQYRGAIARIQPGTASQFVSATLSRYGQSGSGTLQHSNPHDLNQAFSISSQFHLAGAVTLPGPGATAIPTGFILGSLAESEGRVIGLESLSVPFVCRSSTRTEEYSLEFPAEVRITALPKDVQLSNAAGSYRATYALRGNVATVTRELVFSRDKGVCDPEEFVQVRDIYLTISKDLRARVSYK
jgi:transglutaminase-like putative cysteine protease